MLRLALLAPALLLAAGCSSTDSSRSSGSHDSYGDQGEVDMEAMMAEMTRLGTPGEEHAMLAQSAGNWNVTGFYYMEPGAEPTPMDATAVRSTLLDGRVVEEVFTSSFMGMPFEGRLLQGYDNLKEEYWSIWLDNMSTWAWDSTGNYDESGNLVYDGMAYDAVTPDGRPTRMIVRDISADETQMRMYDLAPDGTAHLTMELNYTRAE